MAARGSCWMRTDVMAQPPYTSSEVGRTFLPVSHDFPSLPHFLTDHVAQLRAEL